MLTASNLRLRGLARLHRSYLVYAMILSAAINLLYLAPTIFMMQVYDRVVPTGGTMTLWVLMAIIAFALGTLALLEWLRSSTMQQLALRLDRRLSRALIDCLFRSDQRSAGTGMLREFDMLRNVVSGPGVVALLDLPWTPLYCIVAFMIHPALGVFVLLAGLLLVGIAALNQRQTRSMTLAAHRATNAAYASQEASFRRSEIIRALGMRAGLLNKHLDEREAGLSTSAGVQRVAASYSAVVKFARLLFQSAALAIGAWLAVMQEISIGAIIAASVLLSRALQPVEQLVAAWPGLIQARATLSGIRELFEDAQDTRIRTILPAPKGFVDIQQVSVRGAGGALLLNNVSVSLTPGELLGVIGPSGSGKTTLARVAAGALRPAAGEIRIDGARQDDWDPDRLAAQIGYLPQTGDLLPGTINENISRFAIARGADRAETDEAAIRAAIQAGVHDMILRLENGYDTPFNPARPTLSAGQMQRVMLARALFGDPAVLILDEPNSALDSDGEEALSVALRAARQRGAAIMLVSHRAGILKNADRLLVLQRGGVAHLGTRDEVLAALQRASRTTTVVPLHERAGA